MRLFSNHLEGTFVSRPNRYIVTVATAGGIVEAHCPNPGRLTEILFRDTRVILEHAERGTTDRRTEWTAVAAIHHDHVVPLAAHRANAIARDLILPQVFAKATLVSAEQRLGTGRVDFVVEEPEARTYVEVKSCTLVEHGVAMFPDAPSDRATRHVEELVRASGDSSDGAGAARGLVLFVITHGAPEVFAPNVHTDPAFASALGYALAHSNGKVGARAVYVDCDRAGNAQVVNPDVSIEMGPVDLVTNDGGGYLLIVYVAQKTALDFGLRHTEELRVGYYVYVGSAMRGITARLARHRRKRKNHHWHIDYLLDVGTLTATYPILTRSRIEHDLAMEVGAVADGSVPGFGATDSSLRSHLFYFGDDPATRRDFVEVVFRHRHLDIGSIGRSSASATTEELHG